MQHIHIYVPETHLEAVKQAMFAAGAGGIGTYSHCCWQTAGQGQFMASADSQPFQGKAEALEMIAEYKVEMVCEDSKLQAVLDAMIAAHPYEQVAYGYWTINAQNAGDKKL
jgi:hypothetical protein